MAPALALGNAVILKPDPRTAVCGGVVFARIFEEAGLPDGVLQVLPGGADVGEALVDEPAGAGDRLHRLDRGRPGGRRAGRPAPQARAPGAGRQLGADRAARRRRGARPRRSGAFGLVRPPGPDLHGHPPAPGAPRHRRGVHRACSPRRWPNLPVGDPVPRPGRPRAR